MIRIQRLALLCLGVLWLVPANVFAQIDPARRELIQLGYNAYFEGKAPLAFYAFYYRNQPEFLRTNLTLRLAFAPTYVDSELGIAQALGPHTDLGVGLAGGGFADSYTEVRQGRFLSSESFTGHGGEASLSLYHLFNPDSKIPLNGIIRGAAQYSTFSRDEDTADTFKIPDDLGIFSVRSGLRWGGREPVLLPSLAMELSVWYEGFFRTGSQAYGFDDREIKSASHSFFAEAALAYEMPRLGHTFSVALTLGTTIDPDRFSAFRLGAFLPFSAEFPLSLPGYFYQELTAERFALLGGNYIIPLVEDRRWNFILTGAVADVEYLPGLEQPGKWHSGVGGGIFYRSKSWRVMVDYAYGIEAMRSHGRGAHSIGLLLQLDWEKARDNYYTPSTPSRWRGMERLFNVFSG